MNPEQFEQLIDVLDGIRGMLFSIQVTLMLLLFFKDMSGGKK